MFSLAHQGRDLCAQDVTSLKQLSLSSPPTSGRHGPRVRPSRPLLSCTDCALPRGTQRRPEPWPYLHTSSHVPLPSQATEQHTAAEFTMSAIQYRYGDACAVMQGGRWGLLCAAAGPGRLHVGGEAWAKCGLGVRRKEGTRPPCPSLSQLTPLPHPPPTAAGGYQQHQRGHLNNCAWRRPWETNREGKEESSHKSDCPRGLLGIKQLGIGKYLLGMGAGWRGAGGGQGCRSLVPSGQSLTGSPKTHLSAASGNAIRVLLGPPPATGLLLAWSVEYY